MIKLRKPRSSSRSRRMLLPALLFLLGASFSAAGAGTLAALCLVPAGLAMDAARCAERQSDAGEV